MPENQENHKEIKKPTTKKEKYFHIFKVASVTTLKGLGKTLVIFFIVFFLTGSFFIMGTYFKYANDFKSAKPRTGGTQAIFYDKDGNVIYEGYGTSDPDYVSLDKIPNTIKEATLAAEDKDFYHHGAIDFQGIARAAVKNIQASDKHGIAKLTGLFDASDYSQGGSTITQQLVKNRYLKDEKSFSRKLKEIVYSYELEKKLTKNQILEQYLNNIYYGEQALGIKNAAKIYFGKDLKDLDLAEASMLAGLPAAPSKYDPINGDFDTSKKRQEYVLQQMYEAKEISLDEAKKAANEELTFNGKHQFVDKYPYFVQYVKQQLINLYGFDYVETSGLKVYTTLDPAKQDLAEATAKKYVNQFRYAHVGNAAVVILDNKNDNILAMVGGVDWNKSKVNVADSPRQPGSSFKPIVYATGFKEGYSPFTKLLDQSINFGGIPPYIPHDFSGTFMGNVTARTALANSLNVPTVEMTQLAGVDKIMATAKDFGISTINNDPGQYGLSIGLGSAEVKLTELAEAYATFGNGGRRTVMSGINKVLNNTNQEIYRVDRQENTVIDPRIAYMVTNILSDTKARQKVFGTGNKLEIKGHTVAAKTGTTENFTDSWTMGYNPEFTVGVWMGNNDHSKMGEISGIEGAAYVWHDIFDGIVSGQPDIAFSVPAGLSKIWVNPYTFAKAPKDGPPYVQDYFLPGHEPTMKPDFSYLNVFTKNWKYGTIGKKY